MACEFFKKHKGWSRKKYRGRKRRGIKISRNLFVFDKPFKI